MKIPRVVSGIILLRDKKVMLIKEILEDKKEHWIFPGGGVEFGETTEEAAVREAKEEIGVEVKIKELLGVKEIIRPQFDYHSVIFFFVAEPLNSKVTRVDKILDAQYFTTDEVKNLSLVDSARWAIEEMNKKGIV